MKASELIKFSPFSDKDIRALLVKLLDEQKPVDGVVMASRIPIRVRGKNYLFSYIVEKNHG